MGLFRELKEELQMGKEYVTKVVEGKNSEIGEKKLRVVEEMKSRGYILENEVSEPIYYEGFLGNIAGTKYNLTFRIAPEVKAKQAEEKAQAEKTANAKKKKVEDEAKKRDRLQDKLRKELGKGYCVTITAEKSEIKDVLEKIYNVAVAIKYHHIYDSYRKFILKALKKCGTICVFGNYGEQACENLCKKFTEVGINAQVKPYKEKDYDVQMKIQRNRHGVSMQFFHMAAELAILHTTDDILAENEANDAFYSLLKGE